MESVEEKAKRHLPELQKWVRELLDVSEEMLINSQYSEDYHLGFMALCFLSKQIDHAQSIN